MGQTQLHTGIATPEQIAQWQKKYGDIFSYTCDKKICYLRRPDRKILGYVASTNTSDPFAKNATMIDNCWLGGDDDLRNVDSYFFGLSNYVEELVEIKHGELKKL